MSDKDYTEITSDSDTEIYPVRRNKNYRILDSESEDDLKNNDSNSTLKRRRIVENYLLSDNDDDGVPCDFSTNSLTLNKERKQFLNSCAPVNHADVSADKMSEFYKSFLDKNWQTHLQYNISWYSKNFELLKLSFRVQVQKLLRKII